MDRRSYLTAAGTAAIAVLGGCSLSEQETTPTETQTETQTPEETPTEDVIDGLDDEIDDDVDRIVDLRSAGADPEGDEPIDDVLNDYADDDVFIYLPEGEYLLDEFSGRFRNLTLRGDDATIRPTDRSHESTLLEIEGPQNVVDGFKFDYRTTDVPPELHIRGADGWSFKNCTVRGQFDSPSRDRNNCLLPIVTSPDGEGIIRNVHMPDGAADADGASEGRGIFVGETTVGTLRIDGVWMERWAENTIYAANVPGTLVVENSYFRNTNVAGTRIGGDTILRNNTYVNDGMVPAQAWSGGRAMRGVWISGGNTEHGVEGSVRIEDCDFVFTDERAGGAAIQLSEPITGTLTVRDCRIRQDFRNAVVVEGEADLELEDLHIVGETDEPAIRIGPETAISTASGIVDTRGEISNDERIGEQLRAADEDTAEEISPQPPDASPPSALQPVDDRDPLSSPADQTRWEAREKKS